MSLLLDAASLDELADMLASGAVVMPITAVQLAQWPKKKQAAALDTVAPLLSLDARSLTLALRLAARSRREEQAGRPAPELVWAAHGRAHVRGTTAVATELITRAETDILAMTYSFGDFDRQNPIFGALHAKLLARPGLRARLVLGKIARFNETRPWKQLRDEAWTALGGYWPRPPYPEVYIPKPRVADVGAVMVHAKLVMRDQREVLVTSANLNRSGLDENVEVGVHLRDPVFARQVHLGVEGIVQSGVLVRIR